MNDKSSLLGQLKIDRSEAAGPQRRIGLWAAGGALTLILVVTGSWFAFSGPNGLPVKAAIARALPGGGATAGASMLDASGYVVARRKATVSSKTQGRVVEILVDEGQHVEKDQVVARLDDTGVLRALDQVTASVQQAEAAVAAAKSAFENAGPNYERQKQLLKAGAASQEVHDNAKTAYDNARNQLAVQQAALAVQRAARRTAEQNLADITIRAPFSGVVVGKNAQPGEMISPAATGSSAGARSGICTLVDMDSLEVQVDVSENFISRVRNNQPATIRLNAYPDWQIPGEIVTVIPTADKAKATVMVRVAIKEKDGRVIPDMGARVSFLDTTPAAVSEGARPSGVIVPTDAVQGTGESGTVWVISKETVQKRTVRLGARNADGQTVLSGLSAGEQVAVGDFSQLTDGAKVVVQ